MSAYHDLPYLKLVRDVLQTGKKKTDRTGVGTIAVFGRQMRFDLSDHTIPLLTTKSMHIPSIIHELLWYISGSDNIKYLQENGVRIWNEWADADGNLGPVYGVQWRKWGPRVGEHIDQLAQLIHDLKTNPTSRRLMVSAWNVGDLPQMALPPCHYGFQCYAEELSLKDRITAASKTHHIADLFEGLPPDDIIHSVLDQVNIPKYRLSLMLNMRSNDVGLGNPFNIAQYSILLHMLCQVVNMLPGDFVYSGGDVHIYTNHVTQLNGQLRNVPRPSPTLRFARKVTDIDDFKYEDFIIDNYTPGPVIKMKVAV
jgi:thymidylate synthase